MRSREERKGKEKKRVNRKKTRDFLIRSPNVPTRARLSEG